MIKLVVYVVKIDVIIIYDEQCGSYSEKEVIEVHEKQGSAVMDISWLNLL